MKICGFVFGFCFMSEEHNALHVKAISCDPSPGSVFMPQTKWSLRHSPCSRRKYSRVSFYDGSFYDDSLLRPLSSRTEHSPLVAHHYHNSSVLSVLSALLALFRCARVSAFSILVQFF